MDLSRVSLLQVARAKAQRWLDEAGVEEIVMNLGHLLDTEGRKVAERVKAAATEGTRRVTAAARELVAQGPSAPDQGEGVTTVPAPASAARKRNRVPRRPGILTTKAKETILTRVGDMDLHSADYRRLRTTLCKEFGLTPRQVSMLVASTRAHRGGRSGIAKAIAAKQAKAARKRGTAKKR